MIEKFGADPEEVPATDEQIDEINKLAAEKGIKAGKYVTQKDADEVIDEMNKKGV